MGKVLFHAFEGRKSAESRESTCTHSPSNLETKIDIGHANDQSEKGAGDDAAECALSSFTGFENGIFRQGVSSGCVKLEGRMRFNFLLFYVLDNVNLILL